MTNDEDAPFVVGHSSSVIASSRFKSDGYNWLLARRRRGEQPAQIADQVVDRAAGRQIGLLDRAALDPLLIERRRGRLAGHLSQRIAPAHAVDALDMQVPAYYSLETVPEDGSYFGWGNYITLGGNYGLEAGEHVFSDAGGDGATFATVTWNPMVLSNLYFDSTKFEHKDYPTGNWITVPSDGTIDGNQVKITAKIKNSGSSAVTAPVQFFDAETNTLLPNGVVSPTFPAGETTDVDYIWETEDEAWKDGPLLPAVAAVTANASPHLEHRIKVVLGSEVKMYDTREKPIRVQPKPVILVHGINSNANTWSQY